MPKKGTVSDKTVRLEFVADQIDSAVYSLYGSGYPPHRVMRKEIEKFARQCVHLVLQGNCPVPGVSSAGKEGNHWHRRFYSAVVNKLVMEGLDYVAKAAFEALLEKFPRKLRVENINEAFRHVALYAAQSACMIHLRLDPRLLDIRDGRRDFVQLLVA